jgi:hypothetical protein
MRLEVLKAKKGDCLLLHCGTPEAPALILIDGGPAGVWVQTLKPWLLELRGERGLPANSPLRIDLVVVSHVDDDHINGILALLAEMKERKDSGDPPLFAIGRLWHNSFDDIIGNDEVRATASVSHGVASTNGQLVDEESFDLGPSLDVAKVLASVAQGDRLRELAQALSIAINPEFDGELIRTGLVPDPDERLALEIIVAGPLADELVALQAEFDTWLKRRRRGESTDSALAALDDKSVANLSSIVLLMRDGDQSVLLTGDARSDKIVTGLVESGLMERQGSLEVGILKMPHHGSIRNLDELFVRSVVAKEYVFSGDGKHGNPDRETIDLLLAERPPGEYQLTLTYPIHEIDAERQREHAKEQRKQRNKGRDPGPDWSEEDNSLAAVLEPAPPRLLWLRSEAGQQVAGSIRYTALQRETRSPLLPSARNLHHHER